MLAAGKRLDDYGVKGNRVESHALALALSDEPCLIPYPADVIPKSVGMSCGQKVRSALAKIGVVRVETVSRLRL